MNYPLTTEQLDQLRAWGFFEMYKLAFLPRRAVLVVPDIAGPLPYIIDENGYQHIITPEKAEELKEVH